MISLPIFVVFALVLDCNCCLPFWFKCVYFSFYNMNIYILQHANFRIGAKAYCLFSFSPSVYPFNSDSVILG